MASSILSSFLGALQASVSVLLVIFYGVIATQFGLLDGPSSKKISKVCVRLFLPALLITKVGSQLEAGTGSRYLPILAWAIAYSLVSIAIGLLSVKFLKFPVWVTPAIAFNNTTSLPLLLIESLGSTGILKRILLDGDTTDEAITRAQSYFLVCSIVGNCFTFAMGPRLMDAENSPNEDEYKPEDDDTEDEDDDVERGSVEGGELTSLLPHRVRTAGDDMKDRVFFIGQKHWENLSPRTRDVLIFLSDFFNAPLLGAIVGTIIGMTPALHRAFFNDAEEGGFLNAWLTSSLKKVGDLFVTLQVVVVGVSLSSSLRKMKRGEDEGLPLLPVAFILFTRLIFWPLVSIAVIWVMATKTGVLSQDPILWFTMMLMPCGPPAMKLVAMADVNGASESEKMIIAKLLTVSYACSPLLALAVVGSLYSSEAAINQ